MPTKNATLLLLLLVSAVLPAYGQMQPEPFKKDGFFLGLSAGTWLPTGKNKVLGNPLMAGLVMELKSGKGALSLVFDIIVNVKETDTLYIQYNDDVVKRNNYVAGQIGLEFDYDLYRKNRFAIAGGGGLGLGNMTYYNPNKDIHVDKTSLFLNPGLSLRYHVGSKSYFKFRTQYYIANYKLKDPVSTDFKGNYLVNKIIFVW